MKHIKLKPLAWEDFEGRGAKAQGWRKGNYLIQYWKSRDAFEVVESYPGYQGDSIGDGFYPTLEAAKAAANADHEARMLAAIEPVTAQPSCKIMASQWEGTTCPECGTDFGEALRALAQEDIQ